MRKLSFLCCTLALMAVVTGSRCANPADNKPSAVVKEAATEQEESPGGKYLMITEGSRIEFVGSKVTGSHDGGFKNFKGEVHLVDGRPEKSSIRVSIDTESLWADNEKLTGHLKSPDFFDVATHPMAKFQSTEIIKTGEGDAYTIVGNLDLHGVTKSISFPATIKVEGDQVFARSEFSLKRFDFGIVYPGKADDLIRDEVVVKLDLTAGPGGGKQESEFPSAAGA